MRNNFKYSHGVGLQVLDDERFDSTVKVFCEDQKTFRIVKKPYSTQVYYGSGFSVSRKICSSNIGGICKLSAAMDDRFDGECVRCVSEINKNLYEHLLPLIRDGRLNKIKKLYDLPVSFVFKDNWNSLKTGDRLWYYDFDNFYPSIAIRLGYVSREIIYKYFDYDKDKFKRSRNIALSKIRSVIKVDYYIDGKYSHTISTDTSTVDNAYLNIIMFGRNFINKICDKYRWVVIGRDIDNILYPYDRDPLIINKYMAIHGFELKKYLCTKISDMEYQIEFDKRIKRIRYGI
jgi:hypothetical protein